MYRWRRPPEIHQLNGETWSWGFAWVESFGRECTRGVLSPVTLTNPFDLWVDQMSVLRMTMDDGWPTHFPVGDVTPMLDTAYRVLSSDRPRCRAVLRDGDVLAAIRAFLDVGFVSRVHLVSMELNLFANNTFHDERTARVHARAIAKAVIAAQNLPPRPPTDKEIPVPTAAASRGDSGSPLAIPPFKRR